MQTTKQWQKPQLVILGRGTPEEKVLLGCKSQTGIGPTPPLDHLCNKDNSCKSVINS